MEVAEVCVVEMVVLKDTAFSSSPLHGPEYPTGSDVTIHSRFPIKEICQFRKILHRNNDCLEQNY